ncbi:MAG: RibD family protein [Candidatus Promineifilaceae bacterium]|jgi:riboflavin biosynthesis pyrimidine reductase
MNDLLQLYPTPVRELPLTGAYLAHDLRQYGIQYGRPYIYSDYVTSIDGRIAIPREDGSGMKVPESTANDRDWRLFQELAAQADLVISSGRYLRDWAEGRAQEILRIDDPRFVDLRQWREDRGLSTYPHIAIISGSLEFPVPDILTANNRKVIIFTTATADQERIKEIEDQAGKVIVAGEQSVSGIEISRHMAELGYQSVFNSTGPKVLHLLLEGNALDRLYVTQANKLLGGKPFSSIVEGPLFEPAINLEINSIYLDQVALDGLGQLLLSYNIIHSGTL